jgi:hypothetical protein
MNEIRIGVSDPEGRRAIFCFLFYESMINYSLYRGIVTEHE